MKAKLKIILDSGHGQSNRAPGVFDGGAEGNGQTEEALAWQFVESGKWVAGQFYGDRIEIGVTRDARKESAPVAGRDDEAAAEHGDVFISIHLNSGPTSATGTESLYRDSADKRVARILQTAAVVAFGLRDRGVKPETESAHGSLAIFGGPVPTSLLEVCFVTNAGDLAAVFGIKGDADAARDRRIQFWRDVFDECLEGFSV